MAASHNQKDWLMSMIKTKSKQDHNQLDHRYIFINHSSVLITNLMTFNFKSKCLIVAVLVLKLIIN